ncbi:response regulator transcription factor [Chloroflexota bacterium]
MQRQLLTTTSTPETRNMMEKDIRILVVDDHQVVREGLRHMLGQEEDMELIGQGANSGDALTQAETLSPNIVLMDIKMPGLDGIELTRQIKQKMPSCKVIMLTLYDEYITQAMEAGASGYLLKDTRREELAQAIRRVYNGEVVISESITSRPQIEYEKEGDEKEEGLNAMFEEVQLVLPPPVEANQLMRFATQTEQRVQSRVLQVVGTWQEGTAMTIILNRATPLADILDSLREVPEVSTIGEEPLTGEPNPTLLEKALAIPRLNNRNRKTLFVTLTND